MILTNKQEQGLKIAVERYKNKERYTVIAGYAGSGKSTLIKFIISALGVNPEEEVCYVAFTGKAATVLQTKGYPNATTAHQLLYKARITPNGTYKFFPRPREEIVQYKVIVVDEVSMLPKAMWELLLSHGIYILATGDPGQLPPIVDEDNNHVLGNPHVFLDEIMRQAQDSEIIRFSMWIRDNKPISSYKGTEEQVLIRFKWDEMLPQMYNWADQIICSTNEKRNDINRIVRTQKGYDPDRPCLGDKLIGLHNQWEFMSSSHTWALTNGTIGTLEDFYVEDIRFPYWIYKNPVPFMYAQLRLDDDDTFCGVPIDYNQLLTGKKTFEGKQIYQIKKNKNCPDPPFDFSYAYAITCWKAQGSEYNKVLGFEEAPPYDRETHKKYLYTLATRAKERLVLIRK